MENKETKTEDRETKTKERAFKIWEEEGRPEGRHEEHWDQAEKELSSASPGEERTPDKKIGEVKYAEVSSKRRK